MNHAKLIGVAVFMGAISACGSATNKSGQTGTPGGTGLPGVTTPGGTTAPGGATTTPGATGTNPAGMTPGGTTPASGIAGTGIPMASAGGMTGGSTGGTTGGSTGGMTGGTGTGAPAGACDTSMFTADCKQGGAQWGTPQQLGPCKSGVNTYGVKATFGPYGVKSKYNIGSGGGGTDDSAFCNGVFIPSFGADPVGSADLEMTHDLDFDKYTVFYPGCMPAGEKFPLITWGNGTCAMPEGYGPLLRYVASFGYIVIAANNREVGGGQPMTHGIDVMKAENENSMSEFYQHVDLDKVGAMGHSQGAAATVSAAADPRIKAIIAFNSGTSTDKPFLDVSGDLDLGAGTDPSSIKNSTMAAQQPGAWLWFHQVPNNVNCTMASDPMCSTTGTTAPGHLTLMMEPERVQQIALAWWDMQLKGSADAKNMFIGASCKLCDGSAFASQWGGSGWRGLAMPSLEFGHNAALQ